MLNGDTGLADVRCDGPAVVAFPGAGSFGGEFRPLLRALGPSAWLVRYPGRFGKEVGSAAGSFGGVVSRCVAQVRRRQAMRPVLLGHSYGAYVGYAAASRLEAGGADVAALVVVGATAPALFTVPEPVTRSRADTAAYLEAIEPGLGSGELAGDWSDLVIDTARQDMRLLGGFRAADYPPLRCPVFAVRGDHDPLTSDGGVAAWAGTTHSVFARQVYPGGHSDLLASSEFAAWFREAVIASVVSE